MTYQFTASSRALPLALALGLPVTLAACGDDERDTDSGTATVGETETTTAGPATAGTTMGGATDSTSNPSGTMGATMGTTSGTDATETTASTTDPVDPTDTTDGGCQSSDDCAPDVCVAGECIPPEGGCESNADCQGDTYCCSEGCLPDGEAPPGVCIPWPDDGSDPACEGSIEIGLFEANVQCEWTAPPDGDPWPNHRNVLTTPLVADLPHAGGGEFGSTELIIVSYNFTDGGAEAALGSNPAYYGVIRILSGRTCGQLETIHDPDNPIIASSTPALGDLDGDGIPEIVTHRANSGVIAFKWNEQAQQYETFWVATDTGIAGQLRWDGPSIHDLNNDGMPEVISGSGVFNGATGERLNPGQIISGASPSIGPGVVNVLGDLDVDGRVELLAGPVYEWDSQNNTWVMDHVGAAANRHYAFADFGTAGVDPQSFDPTVLDGVAEIVTVGGSLVRMWTLDGQLIMSAATNSGGPATIGDFDNDGFPEIATAGGTYYAVYDLECAVAGPGCLGNYVRWSQPSQDASSATTGSSIFDFEGDGQAEAVYADECYTRVYEGLTGEVLYSAYRTSCTWYENAVVADVDDDDRSEIVVNSNDNCGVNCAAIDPIHRGVPCEANEGCASGVCDAGYCRCTLDDECPEDHTCAAPPNGTPGMGNTCRAVNPPGVSRTGVRVLRDVLDRWASSRPIWNQHAYSVTNVNDDGTIPATGQWQINHTTPGLNNYRQTVQGDVDAEALPDVTAEFPDSGSCVNNGDSTTLSAEVCNRGNKTVGAGLPVAFYGEGDVLLCVGYTVDVLPPEECELVSCDVDGAVMGEVAVEGNDDGMGGKTTLECIDTNNGDLASPIVCR